MSSEFKITAKKILLGFFLSILVVVIANWISFFFFGPYQTSLFTLSQFEEHKIYSMFEANDIDSVYVIIKEEGKVESEHKIDFERLDVLERNALLDKVREITGAENVIPISRDEVNKLGKNSVPKLDTDISRKAGFYSEISTLFIFGMESTLFESTNIYFFKWYRLSVDLVGLS